MRGACGKNGTDEKRGSRKTMTGKNQLEYLGVNGTTILKWNLNSAGCVDSIHLVQEKDQCRNLRNTAMIKKPAVFRDAERYIQVDYHQLFRETYHLRYQCHESSKTSA
jgi:hypothetical protein